MTQLWTAYRLWQYYLWAAFSITGGNATIIDTDGDGNGVVCRMPRTGSIKHVWLRTSSITTTGDVTVGVETLSSGLPSGTDHDVNCPAVTVNITSVQDNTTVYVDLTAGGTQNACAVTAGDWVAVVMKRPTGSSFAGYFMVSDVDYYGRRSSLSPYGVQNVSTWAKNSTYNAYMIMTLEYSDGSLYTPLCGPVAQQSRSFGNNTSPSKRGNRFVTPPFPTWYLGANYVCDHDRSAAHDLVLYGPSGEVISRLTADPVMSGDDGRTMQHVEDRAPKRLAANTPHYLLFEPTTTTQPTIYEATWHTRTGALDGMSTLPLYPSMYSAYGTGWPFSTDATSRILLSPYLLADVPVAPARTRGVWR